MIHHLFHDKHRMETLPNRTPVSPKNAMKRWSASCLFGIYIVLCYYGFWYKIIDFACLDLMQSLLASEWMIVCDGNANSREQYRQPCAHLYYSHYRQETRRNLACIQIPDDRNRDKFASIHFTLHEIICVVPKLLATISSSTCLFIEWCMVRSRGDYINANNKKQENFR